MNWITQFVWETLWLFLPILAANQGPALGRLISVPGARTPVSERWLGKNKTWAAYYLGPAIALGTLCVMVIVMPATTKHILGLHTGKDLLVVGLGLGFGVILGDHMKSFVKRQLGYPSGAAWLPDRFDFALGGGAAAWLLIPRVSWVDMLVLVIIALPLHYVGNYVSYLLGWRETPH